MTFAHDASPTCRVSTCVIGLGRVGRALSAALRQAGVPVSTCSSRGRLDGATVASADLVILCVADDGLAEVIARLQPRAGQVVAHTSGRHGISVLAPVRDHGAHALAFHPAMTFTGAASDADRLRGASIGLTADADALPVAEQLCQLLGATAVWIAEERRDLYHASLVHGANHLVTLIAESLRLLAATGVADPAALLAPLAHAALDNALACGAAATTGPVVRGDAGTVAAHVQALGATDPAALATYTALAEATAGLAVDRGVLPDAGAILAALGGLVLVNP